MIFVHDKGQMCNNIIQFCHVYAWCCEHGRNAVSMRFAYKYRYFNICRTRWHNIAVYLFSKYAAKLHLIDVVDFDENQQPDEQGMDALLRSHDTMVVEGWQVHFFDLFVKHIDKIRSLFAFLPSVERFAKSCLYPWSGREDCVRLGVHIRRGDYAHFFDGRYFYDDATMQRIISEFQKIHRNKHLVVFICSNDPTLDEDAYRKAFPNADVVFPKGNPGEDLCVLSCCDYLIGAPSSYSLVASMYHDIPLCFITQADQQLTLDSFLPFEHHLRRFNYYFYFPNG